MVGGAAKSPVWPQIVTDVLDLHVTVPAVRDAAARGAAILAGTGAGVLPDAEAGFTAWRGGEHTLTPVPRHRSAVDEAYVRYREMVRRLDS
jgi:sugar (pentulose or hexulose) kinase